MKKKICLLFFLFISNYLFASELIIIHERIPHTFDPYEKSNINNLRLTNMLFDPLVRLAEDKSFEPRLAKKWKTIDERTTRFYLRKDVVFHSGNEFSAKDIIYTFRKINNSPEFKQIFSQIEEVKIVDDFTVDFICKRSFPLILNVAANFFTMDSSFYSIGKKINKKNKKTFASTNASGTGSFKLGAFSENKINFLPNGHYWEKNVINFDKISLKNIFIESDRVDALLKGDASIISYIGSESISKIKLDKRFKVENLSGDGLWTILLNVERSELLANREIRQALNYAIDRDRLVNEGIMGIATPAEQFSPPTYKGHNKNLKTRFDPGKARSLLSKSTGRKTYVFDMLAQDSYDIRVLDLIISMLKDVGVTINLRILSGDSFWDAVADGDADLMMLFIYSDTSDSNNFFEFFAACPDSVEGIGKFNSGKYCNPDVDLLIEEANVVTNVDKRAITLRKIEKKLYDDAMHIPLFWENIVWASKAEINLSEMLGGTDVLYLDRLSVD